MIGQRGATWNLNEKIAEFSSLFCSYLLISGASRYSAAALKAHHMYNAAFDVELLDEIGLKGLTKFVNIEKRRLDGGYQSNRVIIDGGQISTDNYF